MSLSCRRLDENGDYIFGHGFSDYCKNTEAVAQAAKTKLLLLKGEWWEDVTDGTEVFTKILGNSISERTKNEIDIIIKDRVLEVSGVLSIKSFESAIDKISRTYKANMTIETIYGDSENEIVIGG